MDNSSFALTRETLNPGYRRPQVILDEAQEQLVCGDIAIPFDRLDAGGLALFRALLLRADGGSAPQTASQLFSDADRAAEPEQAPSYISRFHRGWRDALTENAGAALGAPLPSRRIKLIVSVRGRRGFWHQTDPQYRLNTDEWTFSHLPR